MLPILFLIIQTNRILSEYDDDLEVLILKTKEKILLRGEVNRTDGVFDFFL